MEGHKSTEVPFTESHEKQLDDLLNELSNFEHTAGRHTVEVFHLPIQLRELGKLDKTLDLQTELENLLRSKRDLVAQVSVQIESGGMETAIKYVITVTPSS